MIAIEAPSALLIYLFLFLFLCFGLWLFSHFKSRNKTTLPPLYRLNTCEYCAFSYLSETEKKISKCPECGSFNHPST